MNRYMCISNKFINLNFNMFMEYYNTVQHATRLRCSILDLVHGKRKITVEMALRFSKYFGTTSKFWLNMQNELDLREAELKLVHDLEKIPHCKQIA